MIEVPLYCRNLGAVFPPAPTVEAKFLETFKVAYLLLGGGPEHYRGTSLIRNSPPPQDPHTALGTSLLYGPRGRRFRMSEVPL